jgi:hypothetical protein
MLAEAVKSGPYVIDSSSFMDWQGRYYRRTSSRGWSHGSTLSWVKNALWRLRS